MVATCAYLNFMKCLDFGWLNARPEPIGLVLGRITISTDLGEVAAHVTYRNLAIGGDRLCFGLTTPEFNVQYQVNDDAISHDRHFMSIALTCTMSTLL